jgi:aminoglycoside N3'-acetyltransferase
MGLGTWAKRILPSAVVGGLRRGRDRVASGRDWFLSADRRDLARAVRRVGVRPGSLLFVHSAYDQMRLIRATPLEIIEVLCDAVGERGTVVMPAFPMSGWSQDYLDEGKLFDSRRTPSQSGLLTEVFRRMPGTERSLHPTHSVAARGARARAVTDGHERCATPFDESSPFQHMLDGGGEVLTIGTFPALTFRHLADHLIRDRIGVPIYSGRPVAVRLRDGAGRERQMVTEGHNPEVCCAYEAVLAEMARTGRARRASVGRVPLLLVSIRDYVEVYHEAQARGLVRHWIEPRPPRQARAEHGSVDGA